MLINKNYIIAALGLFILFITPLALSRFYIYMIALILVYGLLATSLNLVLGFGGIYQFHHAVFYGIGAYGTALMLTKTDFPQWAAFFAGPLTASIISVVIGFVCLRLSKLYFGMLQISLGSLIWAVVYRWYSFTGGDDGIHGIPLPDIISSTYGGYYFILIITLLSMYTMLKIVKSPFGSVLQSIRDNPVRSEMIGVNIKLHQLLALVIAGTFAGVAGALFVVVDNSVFPDMMFWTLSLEVLIMCLLGGWFSFSGPMLGAAIIVTLRTFISAYTNYWTLILGILMIAVIFFLPDGIVGYFDEITKKKENVVTFKE